MFCCIYGPRGMVRSDSEGYQYSGQVEQEADQMRNTSSYISEIRRNHFIQSREEKSQWRIWYCNVCPKI